jgi:SOS-response transcriptional repressor LexA
VTEETGQRQGMSPRAFGEFQRQRVVDFVEEYVRRHHVSPTVTEIGEGLDLSREKAGKHVARLVELGRLERIGSGGARALRTPLTKDEAVDQTDTPWVLADVNGKVMARFDTEDRGKQYIRHFVTGRFRFDGPTD